MRTPAPRLLTLALLMLAAAVHAGEPLRLIGLVVEDRAVQDAVTRPTLRRHLEPVQFTGTLQVTEWLLDRPPLASALARHLHPPLERYHIRPAGDGLYTVDDMGALRGSLRLVAAAPRRRIYAVEGQFRSLAHLVTLTGHMVFTLEYRQVRGGSDPRMDVTPQLFLRLNNVMAHGVMKVLGPLLHGVIDRRVAGLTSATMIVGERITRDPAGLYREMHGWPDVSPADREEFRAAFLAEARP